MPYYSYGYYNYGEFLANNLYVLLLIPVLDGGRIVIVVLEKLFRRKLNERVLNTVMLGSFALVIGLMLFATFNDVSRLF